MEHIFYNRWEDLARTLIIGVLAYVFLIGFLTRDQGKPAGHLHWGRPYL